MSAPSAAKPPPSPRVRRVPLAVWIVLGVAAFHLLLFWIVADRHFLPKVRHLPPPPPVNFGAGQQTSVDPRTGEVTTETQYTVSTQLASPAPLSEGK